MKTINRRQLSQHSGKILDEVAATGEPVEVVSKSGGPTFVITVKADTQYDQWMQQGLVRRGGGQPHAAPTVQLDRDIVESVLADVAEDH